MDHGNGNTKMCFILMHVYTFQKLDSLQEHIAEQLPLW